MKSVIEINRRKAAGQARATSGRSRIVSPNKKTYNRRDNKKNFDKD